jgi:predicted dehydrogenase
VSLRNIRTIKIIGAGSIGNHLAHAGRRLGCDVTVCDVSRAALDRMRLEIYPARYGAWDDGIALRHVDEAPVGGFDLVCVGTPPDSHMALAAEALREAPKALQIEKPLCAPDLAGVRPVIEAIRTSPTLAFVGYDHVVGKAARILGDLLRDRVVGDVATFDVEFREHWGGIFKAHPWLSGPSDSYLGFWRRGGGAGGEHSHALNFWQHLSHLLNGGRVVEVNANVRYVTKDAVDYDDLCFCHLRTEHGCVGRVVQDVVTKPVKKEALIVGDRGTLRWVNGYSATGDAVIIAETDAVPRVVDVPKTRPDDFIWELQHIDEHLEPAAPPSPMSLERGLETMLVVAAAHRSQALGRAVRIDYPKGASLDALV